MYFNFGVWFSIVCAYCSENEPDVFNKMLTALNKDIFADIVYDEGYVSGLKKCKENLPKNRRIWISEDKYELRRGIREFMKDMNFVDFSDAFFNSIKFTEDNLKNILSELALAIENDEDIGKSDTLVKKCTYIAACKGYDCDIKTFFSECFRTNRSFDAQKVQRMIFGCLQFAYSRNNKIKNFVYIKRNTPVNEFHDLYKKKYQVNIPNNLLDDFSLNFAINENMQKAYNDIYSVFNSTYPFSHGRVVLLADDGVGESKVAQMCAKINYTRFRSGVFLGWCKQLDTSVKLFLKSANIQVPESSKLSEAFLDYFDEQETEGGYKHKKWLIVFDGVNDEQMYDRISSFLPKNPYGRVLITSNNEKIARNNFAEENIVSLDYPSAKTSMQELLLGIDSLFRDNIIPMHSDEHGEAQNVCAEIANHLGYNRKVVRSVAEHLFFTYIESCLADASIEYDRNHVQESYFAFTEEDPKNFRKSIISTLRDFSKDLHDGLPVTLRDSEGKELFLIFRNKDGIYRRYPD